MVALAMHISLSLSPSQLHGHTVAIAIIVQLVLMVGHPGGHGGDHIIDAATGSWQMK